MAGNWKEPEFDFSERSDRVTLKLEVGQVVYIPGAADIRNENTDQAELKSMSKEERILEYIRQNGNISTQKVMDLCNYKSRTGARNWREYKYHLYNIGIEIVVSAGHFYLKVTSSDQ